jgi:hypothetical protein
MENMVENGAMFVTKTLRTSMVIIIGNHQSLT